MRCKHQEQAGRIRPLLAQIFFALGKSTPMAKATPRMPPFPVA